MLGCFQVALVWHIGATDGMGGLSRYLLIMLVASHSCAGYLKVKRNTVCLGIMVNREKGYLKLSGSLLWFAGLAII